MIINKIKNQYTLIDKFNLLICWVKTHLFYPGQRIIRNKFEVRGKNMISFGSSLTTGVGCRIEAFLADNNGEKKIFLGDRIQLNDYVHISALEHVSIGDDVLVASHVYISDNSHGSYKGNHNDTSPDIIPVKRPYYTDPVNIGSKVWLGEGVIVMPGATIGDGAIIGAHSIVNCNIPPKCIAVGSPAKVIKTWNNINKHWEKI